MGPCHAGKQQQSNAVQAKPAILALTAAVDKIAHGLFCDIETVTGDAVHDKVCLLHAPGDVHAQHNVNYARAVLAYLVPVQRTCNSQDKK